MRKILSALILIAVLAAYAPVVFAVAHTLNFTAAQDTQMQTKLIPLYNRAHCKQFKQANGCTSANLVTGGCTSITVKTLVIESCTIFTQDTTGEDAFLQEMANQKLVEVFGRYGNDGATIREAAFQGLSSGGQTTTCTDLGLTTPDCP